MKFFSSYMSDENISDRMIGCYDNIKNSVANKCGVSNFIEKDGGIAFSGSSQKPDLLLTISWMKTGGKCYLCADIDDEVSWYEWDFENQEAFENAIVEYITPLINRTIKTVIEKKKHKYIKTLRYYLNSNNEWILIDEDVIDYLVLRLFITKDSIKEKVKSYKIL